MRLKLSLAFLFLSCVSSFHHASAEDLITTDGRTFKSIRVLKEEPDKVKISHADGISLVPKKVMSEQFLKDHELSLPPGGVEKDTRAESMAKIQQFAAQFPVFSTKDGREFKAAEIQAIEPNGLKLMASSGIVRVRFLDLAEKYKTALGYDPMAAAAYEKEQEAARLGSIEFQKKMANAASVVDISATPVRLILIQNMGKGWLCRATIVRTVTGNQVTARKSSTLSGPSVVYESRQVTEKAAVGEIERLMVFGLPMYDTSATRIWEGTIYHIGRFDGVMPSGDSLVIDAFHTDRNATLKFIATHGVNQKLTSEGDRFDEKEEAEVVSGNGTGFAITKDGHIATAHHVIKDATEIQVYVGKTAQKARVVASDPTNDVAILKIDTATQPIVIADEDPKLLGQDLFTIGFPLQSDLGSTPKYTKGSLSGLEGGEFGGASVIQVSIPIQQGNSGGPICSLDGKVLGIVRSTLSTLQVGISNNAIPQNVNFATKSALLRKLAKTQPDIQLASGPPDADVQKSVLAATHLILVTTKK